MPKLNLQKAAGLCGVLAPAVSLAMIFLAIALSPGFNWSANALSDLGVSEAALVFNGGLMLGGMLTVVLATGLFAAFKGQRLRRAGVLLLIIAAAALFGIGVFSEAAGRIHYYFSVAFFVLQPLALFVMGAGGIVSKSKRFGTVTVVLGVLAALPWAFGWSAVAVPEMLSALAVAAWSVAQGTGLYLKKIWV